jgi:hypothetical protein
MEEFNPALAIQADLFHLKERNAKKNESPPNSRGGRRMLAIFVII